MKLLATFLLLRTLTKELLASCFFFVVIIISLLFWCVSPPLGTVENGKPNGNTESGPLAESRSSDPPNSSPNSNLERRCSTTGRGCFGADSCVHSLGNPVHRRALLSWRHLLRANGNDFQECGCFSDLLLNSTAP